MILFYKKDTGDIFATIEGRVHDEKQLECMISDGESKKNIGKYIIGWEETNEIEEYEEEVEQMIELENDLFKKEKVIEKRERRKRIEHNMDKFELLQKFEDITPENPLDYKIDLKSNNLIKK